MGCDFDCKYSSFGAFIDIVASSFFQNLASYLVVILYHHYDWGF